MSVKGINTQHHSAVTGKKSFPEYFFFQYRDDLDRFKFEDAVKTQDLPRCRETYQLESLNSFVLKKRSKNTLHTLYGFCIDIDGVRGEFPLSHLNILERWRALGFSDNPSEVRRTSEGRFHVIIKIMPVRAFPEKISYWKKCAWGFYLAFEDLGADEFATINPVGFVRIPGHPNCKYPDKPIVEIVSESNSILTLTDIHQTLIENKLIRPTIDKSKSVADNIAILESGVPPGIVNNTCFTLAIYYRQQGLSEEEALDKLLRWNEYLIAPELSCKVKSTVKSAFKNGYRLSIKNLNRLASIVLNGIELPLLSDHRKSKKSPDKIDAYARQLQDLVESEGGCIIEPQRSIAKKLDIPFRSFSHAVKRVPGLRLQSIGRGRNAKTEFILKKEMPHLKPVHSEVKKEDEEMTQINDANELCITEEKESLGSME